MNCLIIVYKIFLFFFECDVTFSVWYCPNRIHCINVKREICNSYFEYVTFPAGSVVSSVTGRERNVADLGNLTITITATTTTTTTTTTITRKTRSQIKIRKTHVNFSHVSNGIPNAVPFSLLGLLCMIPKAARIRNSTNLEILLIHHLIPIFFTLI